MLQQEKAEDFVIATGVQYSVRQFITWAAADLGIALRFEGAGVEECAIVEKIEGNHVYNIKVGDVIVRVDPRYFRPTEVETLLGDPTRANMKLGWIPQISAREMCSEMMVEDMAQARQQALLRSHGYRFVVGKES